MFRVKKEITHQNIGGKEFIVDDIISNQLNLDVVYNKAVLEHNIACINFLNRRPDIIEKFTAYEDPANDPYIRTKIDNEIKSTKVLYGHVENLGYIVTEDELEEVK
jgi:hypothetical protein